MFRVIFLVLLLCGLQVSLAVPWLAEALPARPALIFTRRLPLCMTMSKFSLLKKTVVLL